MKTIVRKTEAKQIESITVNNEYLKDNNCIKVLGNAIYDLTEREIGINVVVEALDINAGSIQSENFAATIIKTKETTIFNIMSVYSVYSLIDDAKV